MRGRLLNRGRIRRYRCTRSRVYFKCKSRKVQQQKGYPYPHVQGRDCFVLVRTNSTSTLSTSRCPCLPPTMDGLSSRISSLEMGADQQKPNRLPTKFHPSSNQQHSNPLMKQAVGYNANTALQDRYSTSNQQHQQYHQHTRIPTNNSPSKQPRNQSNSYQPSSNPTSSAPSQHTASGLHGPAPATHLRVAASSLSASAQSANARGVGAGTSSGSKLDIGRYDGGFEADERERGNEGEGGVLLGKVKELQVNSGDSAEGGMR
jgi:hypothetical protein